MIKRLLTFLAVSFLLFSVGIAQAYYNPGKPTGFVNDYTSTLNSTEKESLENKLVQFEKETANEISIVIIKNLQDDTIENFAEKLFKEWGIGKKGADKGVLILVAKEDRQMRIEVGYGLEGALTDAQSIAIINNIMKPAFQNDDFYSGLNGAVNIVISATKGEPVSVVTNNKKTPERDYESILYVTIFLFMFFASILGTSRSWWLGGIIGGIVGVIIGITKGFMFFGIMAIALLVPVGLLFDFIVSRQYKSARSRGHTPWWFRGGGGGGGFGGFGGGLSGGGGASGRW